MNPKESDYRWHGRPLRYFTDSEIRDALSERQEARTTASGMAADLCQIAIDRLQAELEGRNSRRSWVDR